MFLPPALAAQLLDTDMSFECPCAACSAWRASGGTVASLPYHELKRHFALARRWELDLTETLGPPAVAAQLRDASARMAALRPRVALRAIPATDFLDRWASVLENH